jgi:flagellar motor switch protein FliM
LSEEDKMPEENSELLNPTESLIDEIVRMSNYNFERLPMLEIIGKRMASLISESFFNFTGVVSEATFIRNDYVSLQQVADALPETGFFAICDVTTLNEQIMVAMDRPLVLSTLETVLGGVVTGNYDTQQIGHTKIEKKFAARLFRLILSDLNTGFSIVGGLETELMSIESAADTVTITQSANLCVRLQYNIVVSTQMGAMEIIIPYGMLKPFHSKLSRIHLGDQSDESQDSWHQLLADNIGKATVELEAELVSLQFPLQVVRGWKVGDTVNLSIDESREATVFFNGTQSFPAKLGKRNSDNRAVKITQEPTLDMEQ